MAVRLSTNLTLLRYSLMPRASITNCILSVPTEIGDVKETQVGVHGIIRRSDLCALDNTMPGSFAPEQSSPTKIRVHDASLRLWCAWLNHKWVLEVFNFIVTFKV